MSRLPHKICTLISYLHIYPLLRQFRLRYFLLVLLCFISFAKTYGQTPTRRYVTVVAEITKEKKPKKITTKVIVSSAFAGEDSSWVQSLEDSLNKSLKVKTKAKAGKYIVSVRFLFEKDGTIADITCIKDPGFGMCQQVMSELMKKFRASWGPAEVREWHRQHTTNVIHKE
jgi:hypothetical protein